MLNFTKFERVNPEKRDVLQRLKDYKEVYQVFTKHRAIEQADRCMQCGDPYCHTGCPLGNYIPAWLKQTATKNPELAFALSNQTSPFPEILGRICPQDVLCEGACSLNTGHGAISIGAIETYISENAFEKGIKPEFKAQKMVKKLRLLVLDLLEFQQQLFFLDVVLKLKCSKEQIELEDYLCMEFQDLN